MREQAIVKTHTYLNNNMQKRNLKEKIIKIKTNKINK